MDYEGTDILLHYILYITNIGIMAFLINYSKRKIINHYMIKYDKILLSFIYLF